ncbi:hypothetical protein RFI_21373 [Reticulomyxa filosa]|uniref:Uncharacterized protein n=1 Tax=Reticulomyxa filosa TaxID=46433 RepID=X6MQR5_RETFI|nr:hypothetical protein RFI_21373 [Reticulomyxa filosa]|eukprot:ETO15986.1 hypothetical protein RFI_21373 [Reticulomyxa filosa]
MHQVVENDSVNEIFFTFHIAKCLHQRFFVWKFYIVFWTFRAKFLKIVQRETIVFSVRDDQKTTTRQLSACKELCICVEISADIVEEISVSVRRPAKKKIIKKIRWHHLGKDKKQPQGSLLILFGQTRETKVREDKETSIKSIKQYLLLHQSKKKRNSSKSASGQLELRVDTSEKPFDEYKEQNWFGYAWTHIRLIMTSGTTENEIVVDAQYRILPTLVFSDGESVHLKKKKLIRTKTINKLISNNELKRIFLKYSKK